MLVRRPSSIGLGTAADDAPVASLRARAGESADAAALRRTASELGTLRTWIARTDAAPTGAVSVAAFEAYVAGERKRLACLGPALVAPELSPRERLATSIGLVERVLEVSPNSADDVVLYAWMEPAAWRVAERQLGFEQVAHECHLVLEPGDEPDWVASLSNGHSPVLPLVRFDHQSLWLHERAASTWGASVIRDANFLSARIAASRPSMLSFCVLDASDILRGHVLLASRRETLDVLDFLVPDDELEVGRALLARTIAQAGARRVRLALPAHSPWFERLQGWGFHVRSGSRVLAVRCAKRRLDLFWLRDHWWHQPLETGSF